MILIGPDFQNGWARFGRVAIENGLVGGTPIDGHGNMLDRNGNLVQRGPRFNLFTSLCRDDYIPPFIQPPMQDAETNRRVTFHT